LKNSTNFLPILPNKQKLKENFPIHETRRIWYQPKISRENYRPVSLTNIDTKPLTKYMQTESSNKTMQDFSQECKADLASKNQLI
jgi:hypothetical protein